MLAREGEELSGSSEARFETGKRLRELASQSLTELVESLARLAQIRRVEDSAQLLRDPCPQTLGRLGEDVALKVDRAALTRGLGRVATDGGGEAAGLVAGRG